MARVFISYRRKDSQGEAGRLRESLGQLLGADTVFRDVTDIPGGANFERALQDALARCDAVLVLIGDEWLPELQRRLDSGETDFVRLEVRYALASGRMVLPVMLRGLKAPPTAAELPPDLQPLCKLQVRNLRDDIWDVDVASIADTLGRPYNRRALALRLLAMLLILPGALYFALSGLAASNAGPVALGILAAYLGAELGVWAWRRRHQKNRQGAGST